MKAKFYKREQKTEKKEYIENHFRKNKRMLAKSYIKSGMSKGMANQRAIVKLKAMIKEANHLKALTEYFESTNIDNFEFYIETNQGVSNYVYCLTKRSEVKDVEPEVKLSNVDKEGYINLDNLELLNFHIYCATVNRVFEEERADNSDYLYMLFRNVFIYCLFHESMNTFELLKKHIK